MDTPCIYKIRVQGHLGDRWSDWFEGLAIRNEANGDTILAGVLADQAALYGVLLKIHNLNLVLVSVQRSDCNGDQPA
jgi:hypothetical protein